MTKILAQSNLQNFKANALKRISAVLITQTV